MIQFLKILIEVNDERSIMFVMNKKYKVVNVYSGYGEMDFNGFDVVEGKSLKDVCIKLLEEKKKRFVDDCEEGEEINLSYFEEFVNCWGVEGKIGSVGDGEEGYDLVFEEGFKWNELLCLLMKINYVYWEVGFDGIVNVVRV